MIGQFLVKKKYLILNFLEAQTLKKFLILRGELTIGGGDLTPTLKLKRNVVVAKYQTEID